MLGANDIFIRDFSAKIFFASKIYFSDFSNKKFFRRRINVPLGDVIPSFKLAGDCCRRGEKKIENGCEITY